MKIIGNQIGDIITVAINEETEREIKEPVVFNGSNTKFSEVGKVEFIVPESFLGKENFNGFYVFEKDAKTW